MTENTTAQTITAWKGHEAALPWNTTETVERDYGNLVPAGATHTDSTGRHWVRVKAAGQPARNGFWIAADGTSYDAAGRPNY